MKRFEILNIIYDVISEVSPSAATMLPMGADKMPDIFFVDLGINSIDYAEIAHTVMDRLNVVQPIDIFTCTNRISDVVDILYNLANQENNPTKEVTTGFSYNLTPGFAVALT